MARRCGLWALLVAFCLSLGVASMSGCAKQEVSPDQKSIKAQKKDK